MGGGAVSSLAANEDKANSVGLDGALTSKQMAAGDNSNLPMTPNTVAQRLSSEKQSIKKKNNFSQAMNMSMTMTNNNHNLLNS